MSTNLEEIKTQILAVLDHPEAEDGLYLENLLAVHEEEEREAVRGSEREGLEALQELVDSGKVVVEYGDAGPEKPIFRLVDL